MRTGLALKRLGKQVHESRGQQGAGRQAQQVLLPHATFAGTQARPHQQGSHPYTANARRQGGQNNCYQ